MGLEGIALSKISQKRKTNTAWHHLTCGIKNKNKNKGVKLGNIEKELPGVGGWGKQRGW